MPLPTQRAEHDRRSQLSIVLYGGALIVLSVLAWVVLPPAAPRGAMDLPSTWVVVAACVFAAEAWPMSLEHRGQSLALTLSTVPLGVGLALTAPHLVLLGRLVGMAAALVGYWHQDPLKVTVNLAINAVTTYAGAVVLIGVAGGAALDSPMGWLAVFVAVMLSDVLCDLLVLGAMRLAAGPIPRASWVAMVTAMGPNILVGGSLAVISVVTLLADLRSGVALGAVLALLASMNRRRHELAGRFEDLQRLYAFSTALDTTSDTATSLATILRHAREVTGAVESELIVRNDGRVTRLREGGGEGDSAVHRAHGPELDVCALLACTVDGLLVEPDGEAPPGAATVVAPGVQNLLASVSAHGIDLVLVLRDRSGALVRFDDDDRQIAVVLATHSAAALAGARLTEQIRSDADRRELAARTDATTGLPNDNGLLAVHPEIAGGTLAVVGIHDLDTIEASFGSSVAAAIVRQVAERLVALVGDEPGRVSRVARDTLAVVVPDAAGGTEQDALARTLLREVARPVEHDELSVEVRASVGTAHAAQQGTETQELLRAAGVALRWARERGTPTAAFDADHDRAATVRMAMAGELRRALSNGDLRLHYQPKIDLRTGLVTGVEALARWTSPVHGPVRPDIFIDLAERTGLITPLTRWVVREACQQVSRWRRAGLSLSVAINLSNATMHDAEMAHDIVGLIAAEGLPPGAVILEITESQMMGDVLEGRAVVSILDGAGIPLSIDDFGTGYSSLAHLKELPVAEVKIDRAFVQHVAVDHTDRAMVSSIISMAKHLGLRVVAEGIEDEQTVRWLAAAGCDVGQGYRFGRPVPADEVADVVRRAEATFPHAPASARAAG